MSNKIILITIDCGRQDMIYGPEVLTPNIDEIRNDSATFLNAYSQSNVTMPSLISIFTSQYLCDHRVYSNFHSGKLPPKALPNIFKERGWETAAFCGIDFLISTLATNFGNYAKISEASLIVRRQLKKIFPKGVARLLLFPFVTPIRKLISRSIGNIRDYFRMNAEEIVNKAIRYFTLAKNKAAIFAWLHFFDAHMPYYAPKEYIEKYIKSKDNVFVKNNNASLLSDQIRALNLINNDLMIDYTVPPGSTLEYLPLVYRAALTYIDSAIGRLMQYFKKVGDYDSTMIIITSDHGENLIDHGVYCGHQKLYDTTTKVPLIIKFPYNQNNGQKYNEMVEHVDLYPTIVETYFNDNYCKAIRGKSIYEIIKQSNKNIKRYSFCEHAHNYQRSIRDEKWQLIEALPPNKWFGSRARGIRVNADGDQLLKKGEANQENYINVETNEAARLKNELENIVKNTNSELSESLDDKMNVKIASRLRELGYME